MFPVTQNLVVADGQVGTTAAVIVSGKGDVARRYNLTFSNPGSTSETLVITYSRDGGTQRQLRQVIVDADETFELTGLPINKADSVYAVTSNASTLDYVVSIAPDQAPLQSMAYDAAGMPKNLPWIVEQLALVLG